MRSDKYFMTRRGYRKLQIRLACQIHMEVKKKKQNKKSEEDKLLT